LTGPDFLTFALVFVSRDFELGPNLSGLSKIAHLFIASGNLGMFERQMGVASVGVNAGAVDGFSHVNVVWLYHPPYTLYYLDSHSSVSIGRGFGAKA